MVSKEPTQGYQNHNIPWILIYTRYVKVRESFVYPNLYLGQHHSYMVYRPVIVSKTKKNTIKYPYRNGIKICEILVTDIQMVANDQITRSELVRTYTMPTHGTYGTLGNFPSPRESTLPHARFSRWWIAQSSLMMESLLWNYLVQPRPTLWGKIVAPYTLLCPWTASIP